MKTDRELLELAAKAAGYVLVWGDVYLVGGDEVDCSDIPYIKSTEPDATDMHWNPLEDDGDALRLAVKLKMFLELEHCNAASSDSLKPKWFGGGHDDEHAGVFHDECDPYAVTRRAIVRAAAAIGEAMP